MPVVAGFPAGWRPTENPGRCLAQMGAGPAIFETFVPRSHFSHYTAISRAEAVALYPALGDLKP